MTERTPYILLVEDDPAVARLTVQHLADFGYEIKCAGSTAEARAVINEGAPLLMLLDYMLPGENGLKFVEGFKTRGEVCPPFIVMTGHSEEAMALAMLRAGARDYLIKGVSFFDPLKSAVKTVLAQLESARQLEASRLALKGSEERYRTLFEQAADIILLLELQPEGEPIIRNVNPAALKAFGYSPEEIIGKPVSILNENDDAAWSVTEQFRRQQDGGSVNFEVRHKRKDGSVFITESSGREMSVGGKRLALSVERDITARKRYTEHIELVSATLSGLGADYGQNINSLVGLACNILGADAGLYKRLRGDKFKVEGSCKLPDGIALEDKAEGQICHDIIVHGSEEIFTLLRDLQSSSYLKTDPNVSKYGLQTCLGCRIRLDGLVVGCLALVWGRDFQPSQDELKLLGIIASVVKAEEERRHAQGELRKSEETHRVLFEQARDSILLLELSPNGIPVIKDANNTALLLHGHSREELLGKPVSFLDAKLSQLQIRERVDLIERTGSSIFETRHRRKDGSVFDMEVSAKVMSIGGKRFILDISRDITERKKAETAVSEGYEMERMLDVIRQSSLTALPLQKKLAAQLAILFTIPWLAVEPKGAIFLVSGKKLNLFVQQGLAPSLLVSCARVPFGKCLCGRAAESGKAVTSTEIGPEHEIRYEGIHPHGHYCAPIIAAGTTLGVLALYLNAGVVLTVKQTNFVQSVTDIIASDILRARAEEQLTQSQKLDAVGQMAGGIAHDLNNILTAIMGYSTFLGAAIPAGDPKRGDLEEIIKAGERAAVLTHQLLTFSRKQAVQLGNLDLDRIVPETLKMLRRLIPENIEFRTFLKSAPEMVLGNEGQLEQVILNLAVNARDAMPDGGKLTFETARRELDESYAVAHPGVPAGRYVMLAVSDTGSGMSPDVVSHIFEPFFTTKEQGKGTGLGLSIVYGIVKQMGGTILVYSEPGKGTTFKIYLPMAAEKAGENRAEKPALSSQRGTETILVVEDEEPVRKFVSRVLAQNGYTVLEAATPREAIALCELRHDIHLMLTDVVMPQMNGYVLSKAVSPQVPLMKVIFMSGYTDNALTQQNIMQSGMVLLEKPLRVETLLGKVREVLEGATK